MIPVAYGTNVHPAEDLPALAAMLAGPAAAVRDRAGGGEGAFPLGLWLPARIAATLARSADAARDLRARLEGGGLAVATVNAFPAGDFHAARVKERVYLPDWDDPARLAYTVDVARALARLLDPGTRCVVSTSPGTWRRFRGGPGPRRTLARGCVLAAEAFAETAAATGVHLVLAPEPEPGCTLETVEDAIAFWRGDLPAVLAGDGDRWLPHLGICLDLCHASVMGTDPAIAWARLRAAGVPVAKVQISAALEIADPAADGAAVEALRAFDEPRWLHQCAARDRLGVLRFAADLPEVLADLPRWRAFHPWRVHFHAPLHRAGVSGVATTSSAVGAALAALAADPGPVPPALEVETYTWSAVPGGPGDDGALGDAIAAELAFARAAMAGSVPTSGPGRGR